MGLYDFWWNSVQEGKLAELTEENEKLRAEIDLLTASLNAWVNYLNEKIEKLEKK
jgi:cell division protein FtsB